MRYNVSLEKGSEYFGSAVCETMHYLSLCTQTGDPKYSEPFPSHTLYLVSCAVHIGAFDTMCFLILYRRQVVEGVTECTLD